MNDSKRRAATAERLRSWATRRTARTMVWRATILAALLTATTQPIGEGEK